MGTGPPRMAEGFYSRDMQAGLNRRGLLIGALGVLAGCTGPGADTGTGLPSRRPTAPVPSPVVTGTAMGTPTMSATVAPSWQVRTMSFNMLTGARTASAFHAGVKNDEVALVARIPVMVDWIRSVSPDVIGLQENEPMHGYVSRPLQALAPKLPEYTAVLSASDVPFLIRHAAFRIGDHDEVRVSSRYLVRNLTWCWLTHRSTGERLLVANTHLDPSQNLKRAGSRVVTCQNILTQLRRLNPDWASPMLLTGDFNVRADETRAVYREPLEQMRAAGLRSATDIAAADISAVPGASTFNDFGSHVNRVWRYKAISIGGSDYDYVWVGPQASVADWQVVTGPGVRWIDGRAYFADRPVPSDHCPVQAMVEFPLKA